MADGALLFLPRPGWFRRTWMRGVERAAPQGVKAQAFRAQRLNWSRPYIRQGDVWWRPCYPANHLIEVVDDIYAAAMVTTAARGEDYSRWIIHRHQGDPDVAPLMNDPDYRWRVWCHYAAQHRIMKWRHKLCGRLLRMP